MNARQRADEIKAVFYKEILSFKTMPPNVHQGTVIGVLSKVCNGDENRRRVLKFLTGHISSRDMLPAEWYALWTMVQPEKPVGGHWQSAREEELRHECGAILAADAEQEGQTRML